MIWPEVFQCVTANQPGDGGAQYSEYQFKNCSHTSLLFSAKAAVSGRIDEGYDVYILDGNSGKSYRVNLTNR